LLINSPIELPDWFCQKQMTKGGSLKNKKQ